MAGLGMYAIRGGDAEGDEVIVSFPPSLEVERHGRI